MHSGHPGIARMKSIARSYAYWPHIDEDIEQFTKMCVKCACAAKAPVKAELCSWPTPSGPWERVHIDFAGPTNGQYFLILVDAYSKWPDVIPLHVISTTATITALSHVFSQFGSPQTIVTDNGPQFTSAEFDSFCKRSAIEHIYTPPYHPQSNGQVERFVDTFKRSLQKMEGDGKLTDILDAFLLAYRSTPNPATPNQCSPAEAFLNRAFRTSLDALRPQKQEFRRNTVMQQQFNKHHGAKTRVFQPNERVYVLNFQGFKKTWVPALIKQRRGQVLYDLIIDGRTCTRHVNHIRPRPVATSPNTSTILLPLDVLLDTFEIPKIEVTADTETVNEQLVPPTAENRYPRRTRPPTQRLLMDPSRKTYEYYSSNGGRC